MATTRAICLLESKLAEAVDTKQLTAGPSSYLLIDLMTATNTSAAAKTLTVNIVEAGGSAATANKVISALSIPAGASYPLVAMTGQALNMGDFVSTKATDGTSIVIRISGRAITA